MYNEQKPAPKRALTGNPLTAAILILLAAVLAACLTVGCTKETGGSPSGTGAPATAGPAGTDDPTQTGSSKPTGNATGDPAGSTPGASESEGTAGPYGSGTDLPAQSETPSGENPSGEIPTGHTPAGGASASETSGATPPSTDGGSTANPTGTAGQPTGQTQPTPDPDKDILIAGFDTLPLFLEWQNSVPGLADPVLTAEESEFAEDGSALKAVLSDQTRWQYFIQGVTHWSSGRKYLRLWLVNATGGSIDVGLVLKNSTQAAAFNAANAVVKLCDGRSVAVESRDTSGMGNGIATSLVIPHGFAGWVSFPTDSLIAHWSDPMLEGDPSTVSIDVRPSGYVSGGSYFIDGLCLTNHTEGTLRAAGEFAGNSVSANKKLIEDSLSAVLSGTVHYETVGSFREGDCTVSGIVIDGFSDEGIKTKISALMGVPCSADTSLPAIILLGSPESAPSVSWLKSWMEKGYVVIMPDLSGAIPYFSGDGVQPGPVSFRRELPEKYASEGCVLMPAFDMMSNSGLSAGMQWMFHAADAAARCSVILRSEDIVDPARIGIAGIGWGGAAAAVYTGYDRNLAFAIPMQAAAFLDKAASPVKDAFSGSETKALWSAASRLSETSVPMLFIGGSNQGYFDLSCLSESYLAVSGLTPGTVFAIIDGFEEASGLFENAAVQYAFADNITRGADPLPAFVTMPSKGSSVSCEVTGAGSAELYYLTENYTYGTASAESGGYPVMKATWKKATLEVAENRVTGSVPSGAVIYFVKITGGNGLSVASVIFD